MSVTITTTWKALFSYAAAEGQARVAFKANPTPENEAALKTAITEHEDYRQLCLQADRMTGLEGILSNGALRH